MDNGFTDREWWTAYDEGHQAFTETSGGCPVSLNPYANVSEEEQHKAWMEGWNDAEFEEQLFKEE